MNISKSITLIFLSLFLFTFSAFAEAKLYIKKSLYDAYDFSKDASITYDLSSYDVKARGINTQMNGFSVTHKTNSTDDRYSFGISLLDNGYFEEGVEYTFDSENPQSSTLNLSTVFFEHLKDISNISYSPQAIRILTAATFSEIEVFNDVPIYVHGGIDIAFFTKSENQYFGRVHISFRYQAPLFCDAEDIKISSLQATVNTGNATIQSLENEVSDLENQLVEYDKVLDAKNKENEVFRTRIAKLKRKIRKLKRKIAKLKK